MSTNKIKIGTKFILALILSFILVKTQTKKVFFGETPRINPNFIASIKNIPYSIQNIQLAKKAKIDPELEKIEKLPLSEFNKIADGVYAKEDRENNTVYIRVEENIEFEDKIINYNGKQITVKFPKGTFK